MTDNNLMPQLQKGDVVFFAWSGRPADPTYGDFAHLAGAVQALGHRKPTHAWFHVGVMADSRNIIEFGQENLPEWTPLLQHALDRAGRQPITVLRATDSNDAKTLAEAMAEHVGEKIPYNVAALLAFAFATQRRVFDQKSAVHQDLGIITNGALRIAKKKGSGGSCVSLIVDALHLEVPEPRGGALNPAAAVRNAVSPIEEILKMEQRLTERVRGGQLASMLGEESDPSFQPEEFENAYYSQELEPQPQDVIGPMLQATADYVNVLVSAVGAYFDGTTLDDLRTEGAVPYGSKAVPSLLVSPAMLYDALIARGFTKV